MRIKKLVTKKIPQPTKDRGSSIDNWGYKENFKPVYIFFYEKILCAQTHSQANINQQNKNKRTKNNKGNGSLRAQTFKEVKVTCLGKINRFEISLVTSITYTTDVYSYQPAYQVSVYTHLFLFVAIRENLFFLWKSFWIFFIRENLFFLWEIFLNLFYPWRSLLFMKIFFICENLSFLWKSFRILFIRENLFFLWKSFWIFFICENLFFLSKSFWIFFILENLFFSWKSFWILFIRENLFFLWKSFLSVRISSFYENLFYFWESLLFIKTFFVCENLLYYFLLFFCKNLCFHENKQTYECDHLKQIFK